MGYLSLWTAVTTVTGYRFNDTDLIFTWGTMHHHIQRESLPHFHSAADEVKAYLGSQIIQIITIT
jgi:hypothetical protein